jgi:galactokinase
MNMSLFRKIEHALFEHWGSAISAESARRFFSPARINLIGDHIDYCGGKVLPAAIQFGTFFIAGRNELDRIRVYSLNQEEKIEFSIDQSIERTSGNHWGNYIKGVFFEYQASGHSLPALDIALAGDIPGGGLSSSASLEVGIAYLIEAFMDSDNIQDNFARRQAISWLAQRAENDFVGMNCGVMDQASVALGEKDMAMCLDCETLDVDYVPVALGGYSLLIMNSCKDRNLTESAYNQRRQETETALSLVGDVLNITSLCDLDISQLGEVLDMLDDELLQRRARHVITENHRVLKASGALKNNDLEEFGRLLNESHHSLRYDYEVTGVEMDILVDLAQQQVGVLGARMMGGGFGGCGLALLRDDCVEQFIAAVGPAYRSAIGYDAAFYPVDIVDGVHEVFSGKV